MDGKIEVDIDRQFRKEGELFVNVICRRVWMLKLRLKVFAYLVRIAGFVTRLRVSEITAELEEPDES